MTATLSKTPSLKLPIKAYVEFYFLKYKRLSSHDLAILISHKIQSKLPFSKLQNSIRMTLGALRKDGKIVRSNDGEGHWQLVETNND